MSEPAAWEQLALPEDLKAALRQAVKVIVAQAQPQLIILFGSWAEGRARPDSDVDLLVVAEAEDRLGLAADLRDLLAPLLGPREFDLLLYPPRRWDWGRRITGLLTYEADRWGVRLYDSAA
ncbi:MAG TPA: nucleotidyltransferase domain-containing protein [Armatimonadota bacterium]|jgi:predicted nucleotidyltransferase